MSDIPYSVRDKSTRVNAIKGLNFDSIYPNELFKKQDANNVTGANLFSTSSVSDNKLELWTEAEVITALVGTIRGEISGPLTKLYLNTTGIDEKGITITSQGRVGIGVTNPEEDLELDGNIQLDTGGVQRGRVIFYDKQNDHEHAEVDGLGEGTNGGVLAFYTKVDGESVTEKMRINNVGNVGIGTNNPTRKLEVNGDMEGDNLFAQTFGPTYSVLPSLIGKIGQIVNAPYTSATLEYNNLIQVRSLTIPYTGVWAIDMSLFLGNATLLTGDIRYSTQIHVNGVNTQRFHGTNVTGVDGSCKRNLNANDVVSFHTRLTGDDAASMTATERLVFGPVWTFLSATRIA